MKKQIKNNVSWVGKVDWELKQFHGNEFSTNHGSTYNAYLIQEKKTVSIDTVWMPYGKEFVRIYRKRRIERHRFLSWPIMAKWTIAVRCRN